MAIEDAQRDQNYVPTLLGVDMTTGEEPTKVYVDEDTHRLLVSAVITGSTETNYATKIDTTSTTNVIYIGKAAIGSSGASAVWQIKKLNTATLALDKTWADSNDSFDNIWDNRTGLTYG